MLVSDVGVGENGLSVHCHEEGCCNCKNLHDNGGWVGKWFAVLCCIDSNECCEKCCAVLMVSLVGSWKRSL